MDIFYYFMLIVCGANLFMEIAFIYQKKNEYGLHGLTGWVLAVLFCIYGLII